MAVELRWLRAEDRMKRRIRSVRLVGVVMALGLSVVLLARPQGSAPVQTGIIQGTVVRDGTSEPIAGVQVTLGGIRMNPRDAQLVLNGEAAGMTIPPEYTEA